MEDRIDDSMRNAILKTVLEGPKKEEPSKVSETIETPTKKVKEGSPKSFGDLLKESLAIKETQDNRENEGKDELRKLAQSKARLDIMKDWRF